MRRVLSLAIAGVCTLMFSVSAQAQTITFTANDMAINNTDVPIITRFLRVRRAVAAAPSTGRISTSFWN